MSLEQKGEGTKQGHGGNKSAYMSSRHQISPRPSTAGFLPLAVIVVAARSFHEKLLFALISLLPSSLSWSLWFVRFSYFKTLFWYVFIAVVLVNGRPQIEVVLCRKFVYSEVEWLVTKTRVAVTTRELSFNFVLETGRPRRCFLWKHFLSHSDLQVLEKYW